MIVVDASVAAKWLLPEVGSDEARTLLERGERLVAPSLARVEVAGSVLRNFRDGTLTEETARAACDLWSTILENRLLHLIPMEELFDAAVALAFECRHTVADCLYVAAGKRLGASVITADKPLYRRCSPVYDRLLFLGPLDPH